MPLYGSEGINFYLMWAWILFTLVVNYYYGGMYVRPIKYYYIFLLQIFNINHSIKLHIRAPLRHTEIITVSELFKSSISFWDVL